MSNHIPASRDQQSLKIINLLLDDFSLKETAKFKKCLDVGCGTGEIGKNLSTYFQFVVGIEVDLQRIKVDELSSAVQGNFYFTQADGAQLPFEDNSFDFIICAQVYEHTIDQEGLIKEIWRVLRKDGKCFFSGPNKYTFIEEHYFLPFLSWFPQRISDKYVQFFNRNPFYDIYPLSYKSLQKLLSHFSIEDATIKLLRNPERYGMEKRFGILAIVKFLPNIFLQSILYLIPNFNWILTKSTEH